MRRSGARLGLTCATVVLATAAAPAWAQTAIVPDTGAGFATGTTVDRAGTTFFINDGAVAGSSLFHSFNAFSLGHGDSAVWNAPVAGGASIAHVINRVTGGSISEINGGLSLADMPGASFWFINPAGIVFGEGAHVDVPGAAYFATAHELRLGDGAVFSTVTPDGSRFSSAPPAAFGFLGRQGDLVLAGAGDSGPSNSFSTALSLWLGGADIAIRDSRFTVAALDLRAVGDGVEAIPADPENDVGALRGTIDIRSSSRLALGGGFSSLTAGTIHFDGARIDGGTGDIQLRANELALSNTAYVRTRNSGATDAGTIRVEARDSLLLTAGSGISTRALSGSTGDSGDIALIVGRLLTLDDNSEIAARTEGAGDAGDISLRIGTSGERTGVISITGRSNIGSSARPGSSGHSGNISIEAGESLSLSAGRIFTDTTGPGDAGTITLRAPSVGLIGGGAITSTALAGSTGQGGDIAVIAGDVLTLSSSAIIALNANDVGDAGNLLIRADLLVAHASGISTSAWGDGDAGMIAVKADQIEMDSASAITSESLGEGDAGAISFDVERAFTMDYSFLSTSALGEGQGGILKIHVGGELSLSAATIQSETGGAGDAGAIELLAGSIELDDESRVTTTTNAEGDAGSVRIETTSLELVGGSRIRSVAGVGSQGSAGSIAITTQSLALGGVDDGSLISRITTSTAGLGSAGSIDITTGTALMRSGADITSGAEVGSPGDGGSIVLIARENWAMESASRIYTDTIGSGEAGAISIRTDALSLADSEISSSALAQGGRSGSIVIETTRAVRLTASSIETLSVNDFAAGSISVSGERVILAEASSISSDNTGASGGAAGSIAVVGDQIRLLDGSSITSDAVSGPAGAITLTLPETGVLELSGEPPSAISTTSGPGAGGRITIANPYLILSDGGSILALGEQGGANVSIESEFFLRSADRLNLVSVEGSLVLDSQIGDLSAGAIAGGVDFLDASATLGGRCAATRATGQVSQFSVQPTGIYSPVTEPFEEPAEEVPHSFAPAPGGCA